jgi:two-component system sensor histidine kinase MprB
MTLRVKIVLLLAGLTALCTTTIGAITYLGVSNHLEDEVDRSLADAAHEAVEHLQRQPNLGERGDDDSLLVGDPRGRGFEQVLVQELDTDGNVTSAPVGLDLPVGEVDRAVARRGAAESRRDVTIDGEPFRVLTVSAGDDGGAVQLARSLAETRRLLDSLRVLTIGATFVVTALAAVAAWLLARQITGRLSALTATAEGVARTGQLTVEIPSDGHDEAARLGRAFGDMLAALASSRDAQQRLVQDAGHELRTPLTSLRTNVSVLRRHRDLPPETTRRVLDQIDEEAHELTDLVNEVVELATDRRDSEPVSEVELASVVDQVARRTRRRTDRTVLVDAERSVVLSRPSALERAVTNLVDNATKFDPDPNHPVEVEVRKGRVTVSDRGPGIAPADLPHVFDRFYRSDAARRRPGSGLGLSIVRDVAEAHGGSVFAENRPGGGARVGFELPTP